MTLLDSDSEAQLYHAQDSGHSKIYKLVNCNRKNPDRNFRSQHTYEGVTDVPSPVGDLAPFS